MPVPNDLTAEEEQMFSQHGVAPAGQGQEPTGEPNQPAREEQPRDDSGRFASHGDRQPATQAPAAAPEPQAAPPQTPQEPSPAPEGPAPEQPQGEEQPQPGAPPPGFVPHAALHQERQQRQQLQHQLALLTARTNAMLMAQQQPQPEELPDLESNPVEYVRALGDRFTQMSEQQAQTAEEQQIFAGIERDEAAFRQFTPDYDDASDHYVTSRAQELSLYYPPQEVQRIMLTEATQMARQAWQRGVPVAQMIYQAAAARGYRPGGQPQPAPQGQPQMQQAPQPPAQQQASAPGAQQVLAAVAQNQGVSRSLSTGSGSGAASALNAESLLKMSDEEFERHLALGSKGANARFAAIG